MVDEGRICVPTAPRLRTLLALLSVRANTVVSRTELLEELWGVDTPAGAANTLHVFVGRLRHSLAPELGPRDPAQVVCTSAAGYLLRLDPDQLDVSRFEQLLADGRRAFHDDAVSA
ncbi:MAG: AfsR/SARP family transcriptional regulator, partial [Micromonosporaceae bacterium]